VASCSPWCAGWPPRCATPDWARATAFERCLIQESLAGPVMFTYLGRCLVTGGTVVLPDGLGLPEAIEGYRVSATLMPPARLHQVLRSRADLSSLRAVVLGGSPASPGLLRAATGQLGPIVFRPAGPAPAPACR
jgi:fatty-acyl-CoA synthase